MTGLGRQSLDLPAVCEKWLATWNDGVKYTLHSVRIKSGPPRTSSYLLEMLANLNENFRKYS